MGLIILIALFVVFISILESHRLQRKIDFLKAMQTPPEKVCPPHKWRYTDTGRMVCIECRKPPFADDKE